MKIKILAIGKTDDKCLQTLADNYLKRLRHYVRCEVDIIPDIKNVKNMSQEEQKEKEGMLILQKLDQGSQMILLDEKGKAFRSREFAGFMQKKMNSGIKQIIFVIGGPYGFSESVYKKASEMVSFSKMTFSHQMIRLFAAEQIYRAFTIIRNEPYHHE